MNAFFLCKTLQKAVIAKSAWHAQNYPVDQFIRCDMKDSKGQYNTHTVHTKCRVVKLPRATINGLSVPACNLTFTKKNRVNDKLRDKQTSCTFEINLQGAFVLLAGNEYQITFEEKPCCEDLF